MDCVLVNHLVLDQLELSPAPWAAYKHQLAYLSVSVQTDTSQAGATDDLQYSISYSTIAKGLRTFFSPSSKDHKLPALSAHELAEQAAKWLLFELQPPLNIRDSVLVKIKLPEALLHGGKLVVQIQRDISDYSLKKQYQERQLLFSSYNARDDSLTIDDFQISTIIGLNDCERKQEQPLIVQVQTWPNFDGLKDEIDMAWSATMLQEAIWQHVRSAQPLLLEALCPSLSSHISVTCRVPKIRVRLDKPKAVMWTSTTAVETVRHRNFCFSGPSSLSPLRRTSISKQFSTSFSPSVAKSETGDLLNAHTAYIAIGSNIGDRLLHIKRALALLDNSESLQGDHANQITSTPCKVIDTSFLYESQPMYVLEQNPFFNAVCKVSTSLSPQDLLALLKKIEGKIGRRKTVEKGPREIDLDILLYDDHLIMRDEKVDLTIPHPLIAEREFVLRPLADLAPTLSHPVHKHSIADLLQQVLTSSTTSQLRQIVPLSGVSEPFQTSQTSRTLIMSILNVTPDSFSDGGSFQSISEAVSAALTHIDQGADIVDIGGVSTRPGSSHVTEEEELARVLPVIHGIREKDSKMIISVDTFRASVASKSIAAGANIINDISGGMQDGDMLETVAKLDVPFVLMHMRGKPEEVNNPQHQAYEKGDVIGGVRKELIQVVRKALAAGIKRWNIILDPGIGFSKNAQGNLAILRDLPAITGRRSIIPLQYPNTPANIRGEDDLGLLRNFPILVGASRKGFIGKITGRSDPKEREYGNSAVHALAIANGASIIRVHDVKSAKDAASITDAIYGRQ